MAIVLKGHERQRYPEYFDQLFQLRYQVFVSGRGWSLPSRDGREVDQYDTDETVYFFDFDEEGRIEGTVRLTPTLKGSLTADYYPHLIENGEPPRAPDIYEATRYVVLPTRKSRESNRRAKAKLLIALTEWCLASGVSAVQTVIDSATLQTFVEMNPGVRPMGLSHPYGGGRGVPGGGEAMVIRWPATAEALASLIEYGGLNKPTETEAAQASSAPSRAVHQ